MSELITTIHQNTRNLNLRPCPMSPSIDQALDQNPAEITKLQDSQLTVYIVALSQYVVTLHHHLCEAEATAYTLRHVIDRHILSQGLIKGDGTKAEKLAKVFDKDQVLGELEKKRIEAELLIKQLFGRQEAVTELINAYKRELYRRNVEHKYE